MKWFVVRTAPRCEFKALDYNLTKLNIESYVPSYKAFNKNKNGKGFRALPLIHSYLFFSQNSIDFSLINNTLYTKSVLRINGLITEISDKEIQAMKDHIENKYFGKDLCE